MHLDKIYRVFTWLQVLCEDLHCCIRDKSITRDILILRLKEIKDVIETQRKNINDYCSEKNITFSKYAERVYYDCNRYISNAIKVAEDDKISEIEAFEKSSDQFSIFDGLIEDKYEEYIEDWICECIEMENNMQVLTLKEKNIAFINAIKNNNLSAAQYFLRQGADINAKDKEDGHTALHWTAIRGYKELAKWLIDKNTNLDIKDDHYTTALQVAIIHFQINVAEILIEHGANIEVSNWGDTPLHMAAKLGYQSLVSLLIKKGGNPKALNGEGKTPSQLAEENNHKELASYIKKYEGKQITPQNHARLFYQKQNNPINITKYDTNNNNNNQINDERTSRVDDLTIKLNELIIGQQLEIAITNRQPQIIVDYPKKIARKKGNNGSYLDKNPTVNPTDDIIKQIESAKPEIIEHAERRVDFYFYTLIYYYNTHQIVELGPTYLQNGQGSNYEGKKFTAACHSPIISSPIGFINTIGANQKPLPMKFNWDINNFKKNTNQFLRNLNATVTLPVAVNNFDQLLEGQIKNQKPWRATALEVINQVSQGKLTPIQGLALFFNIMKDFFSNVEFTTKNPVLIEAYKIIHNYEEEGTFSQKWIPEQKILISDYVHSLLRLTGEEVEKIKAAPEQANNLYEQKYENIREEILESGELPTRQQTDLYRYIQPQV